MSTLKVEALTLSEVSVEADSSPPTFWYFWPGTMFTTVLWLALQVTLKGAVVSARR